MENNKQKELPQKEIRGKYQRGEIGLQEAYSKLTEIVLNRIDKSLEKSQYTLIRLNKNKSYKIDADGFITTEKDTYYCLIDVKISLNHGNLNAAKQRMTRIISHKHFRFAIITDASSFYFYDSENSHGFESKDYDFIIRKLLYPDEKQHKTLIRTYINENFHPFDCSENDICFSRHNCFLKKSVEDRLTEHLFKFKEYSGSVYRYTSLNTIFETLKSGKIRMFGIAGMNDASEVNYIEKNFNPSYHLTNTEINNVFIMSCNINKKDDLTLWRLYGDEAKGVCLKFNLKEKQKGFIFRKIKYIDSNDKTIKKLKGLVDHVNNITGRAFVFKTLHEWCHFIKPKDYEVESEVRLLYQTNDSPEPSKWVIANKANIINPYMEFDLNDFPLELVGIKLGPKCPELDTNLFQLKAFVKRMNLKIKVSKSEIKNYR